MEDNKDPEVHNAKVESAREAGQEENQEKVVVIEASPEASQAAEPVAAEPVVEA